MDSRSGANLGQAHFPRVWVFDVLHDIDRHISLAPTDLGQALSVAASDLGQALEPIWDRHISLAPTDLGQALSVAVE